MTTPPEAADIQARISFDDDQLCLHWRDRGVMIIIDQDGTAILVHNKGRGWATSEVVINPATLKETAEMLSAKPGIPQAGELRERVVAALLSCDGPPIMQASMQGYEERLVRWHKSCRDAAEKRADAIIAIVPSPDEVEALRKELAEMTALKDIFVADWSKAENAEIAALQKLEASEARASQLAEKVGKLRPRFVYKLENRNGSFWHCEWCHMTSEYKAECALHEPECVFAQPEASAKATTPQVSAWNPDAETVDEAFARHKAARPQTGPGEKP